MTRSLTALGLCLLMVGCVRGPVVVTSIEHQAELVRVHVASRSDQDVRSLALEVEFRGPDGSVVQVDTVRYTSARSSDGASRPLIGAGEESFFIAETPEGATEASARFTAIEFWDGSDWTPEG